MTFAQRADRARVLAKQYPASSEVLVFYAGLADWQSQVMSGDVPGLRRFFPSLLDLVTRTAPDTLAGVARSLGPVDFDRVIALAYSPENFSPVEFFSRVLLQPYVVNFPAGLDCPWCRRLPQLGCLLPQAEGLAFEVVCGLCLRHRGLARTQCPACNETSETQLANFTAAEFAHLRVRACDSCHGYLLVVDLSRDASAIPEVDELAGLPLDLWAQERGYHKLQPNIVGI
jgi:formate dehydrogenase maturation protein FdhE